jgi:transposase-like protein
MSGDSCRDGLHKCRDCDRQFTVTVGTVFQDSHIPLCKWVEAFHLLCSERGINASMLQRCLNLGSYRTAWRMMRVITEIFSEKAF